MTLTDRIHAIDSRQQRTPGLRFLAAFFKKLSDDQASWRADLLLRLRVGHSTRMLGFSARIR